MHHLLASTSSAALSRHNLLPSLSPIFGTRRRDDGRHVVTPMKAKGVELVEQAVKVEERIARLVTRTIIVGACSAPQAAQVKPAQRDVHGVTEAVRVSGMPTPSTISKASAEPLQSPTGARQSVERPAPSPKRKAPPTAFVDRSLVRPAPASGAMGVKAKGPKKEKHKALRLIPAVGMHDPHEHSMMASMPPEANGSIPKWNSLEGMASPARVSAPTAGYVDGSSSYTREKGVADAPSKVTLSTGVGIVFDREIWPVEFEEDDPRIALMSRPASSCRNYACTAEGSDRRRVVGGAYCPACTQRMTRADVTRR